MRWLAKKNKYKEGEVRTSTRFLWFPYEDEEGYMRWLEKAVVEEKWCEGYCCVDVMVAPDGIFKWRIQKVMGRDYGTREEVHTGYNPFTCGYTPDKKVKKSS